MKALKPKGDTYYKMRAANYERKRLKQEWWHVEQKEMKDLLEKLPKGLKVLDVPFGTGRFVPYYAERDYQISGLDASDAMLAAAKEALGELYDRCDTRVGFSTDLPYADASFDLVVSTRFLRDIITFGMAKQTLSEMARVTTKYAILQLGQNPNGDQDVADDEVMASLFSGEHNDELLRNHGFEPVERRLVHATDEVGEVYHILCHRI